ncbi:histidine kinase [Thermopolyspora sp. NPDC052614]|uniref:sensor histidine kinase n=1 Tax=Thermopolyspora sp. NPDC052614 TaxID=3155682 RepID=UPI003442BC1E
MTGIAPVGTEGATAKTGRGEASDAGEPSGATPDIPGYGRGITLARSAAVVAAVASPALIIAALVIQAALPPEWRPEIPATPEVGAGLTFPAVGAFLVHHRPRLTMAWMMIAGGLAGGVAEICSALMLRTAADGDLVTAGYLRYGLAVGWAMCGLLLATLLPLVSPDGRLPSRRWRPVAVVCSLPILVEMARIIVRPRPVRPELPAVVANPLEIPALAPYNAAISQWAWVGILAAIVVGLLSLAARFRRAGPEPRRQIAWPLLGFTGYVVFLLIGPPVWHVATVWAALIPAAIAFSVTRYRLYGIDTVISRTFVAAGLLAVVGSVYFAAGALSSLVVSEYDRIAGLVAALFAGAVFQPLRRRLQRLVDRMLYGDAGDPGRLADRLTRELHQADPAEALASVVAVLRDGLAVTGAAVEVPDGRPSYVESGMVGSAPRRIPLIWHGERVGSLLLGPPGPRRFSAAHGERVLAALTPHAADVAHAVRMAADLQRSRERILGAREEERRRLRRDLHDGLGQSLSTMAMTLNMARIQLKRSPDSADELLMGLRSGMDAVAGDIRELVYGLRPPALDDLGLEGAIRALAGEAPPQTAVVVSGDLGGLPAAVEVAVYRIVQEALTNIRRHANATAARIDIRRYAGDGDRNRGLDGDRNGHRAGTRAEGRFGARAEDRVENRDGDRIQNEDGHRVQGRDGGSSRAGDGGDLRPGGDGSGAAGHGTVLRLRVADNGIGLPSRPRSGVGLTSMRERAAELGGTCSVISGEAGGTLVEAMFPYG